MELKQDKIMEIATRIKGMREIAGMEKQQLADAAEVDLETYESYESGLVDLPFTFIHKCALALNIGLIDLLEGYSAQLSSYVVTKKGEGTQTAKEEGIDIKNLAPLFRDKASEPYFVKYEYKKELQNQPIHMTTHGGQEFDYVLSGELKVQIGNHIEVLESGDSIYYNSSTPHGMIATSGKDCTFLAMIMQGDGKDDMSILREKVETDQVGDDYIANDFITTYEDEEGRLEKIEFHDAEKFNFAFDVIDKLGTTTPNKTALVHLDKDKHERIFSYKDMMRGSSQCANYFASLGIKKGDKVMLVLKRHYQFWFAILALHKIGAVAVPATAQLMQHDFEYRFNTAGISAIVCTADHDLPSVVDLAQAQSPTLKTKIVVGGSRKGWYDYDSECKYFTRKFVRTEQSAGGDDTMFMLFTSGTTGYPKIAEHPFTYALGHYHTAKYWHSCERGGLHLTISDTGWGKSLWGKLYGQWLCECGVFVYDFERFSASDILPMFEKYNITTFCAPPTMLRLMIKEDLSNYNLSSIKHMTTAGEALNPEVYNQFFKKTGLSIMEGFGQTETTLLIANLRGRGHKIGSMGRAVPLYDIKIIDNDYNEVPIGQTGEICIDLKNGNPYGLFKGYYNAPEANEKAVSGGFYHTGDVAWKDEDGYIWYVSRIDDVIKSSGYRIGPFEIESVIMELPYVLECGVSAAPDEVRGQVVKASIVLTEDAEASDELKKAIQDYVKKNTAPYKYPRIIEFRDELPKTISGKIQRNKL